MFASIVRVVLILGMLHASAQVAAAGGCDSGCGSATKTCLHGSKIKLKGCSTTAIDIWLDAKPICTAAGDCTADQLTLANSQDVCRMTSDSDELSCAANGLSCFASCDANPGDCMDACGKARLPAASLKTCVKAAAVALGQCKAGCTAAPKGPCIQGCGATAIGAVGTCRATFDSCAAGC